MTSPEPRQPTGLSHLDSAGRAVMVDVGQKAPTRRRAVAEAFVRASPEVLRLLRAGGLPKGNAIEAARLAGIGAAKRTDELIPLCHSLTLEHADVRVEILADRVRIEAEVSTTSKTGVEMEALAAAAVAALTVIDMAKAVDRGMVIEGLRVLEKTGGRSGAYRASESR